jgi:hypothetical protein
MCVKPILDEELGLIRHAVEGGRQRKVLQRLHERGTAEELVEREYDGRYMFELLQNADDAARSGCEQSN